MIGESKVLWDIDILLEDNDEFYCEHAPIESDEKCFKVGYAIVYPVTGYFSEENEKVLCKKHTQIALKAGLPDWMCYLA